MKKFLLNSFFLFTALNVFSQGIDFEHGSWAEIVKKAKELNKPIFVDVYTSWCGPCKVMAAKVFPRPEIGTKYNNGFVNAKIDAEKGEGIAIAKKYKVESYPTYLFINPFDESLVDRSKSSMAAAEFNDLADEMLAKFSGKKQVSLADLDVTYKSGNFDEAFAQAYIKRLKAERKPTNAVLGNYISRFVANQPTADQLYFIGLNFMKGAGSDLYHYMIDHYKKIDAVLCKRDGIAAATLYRLLREETISKIDYAINSKKPVVDKETELNKLYADLNTVEIEERKNKKVLEYKIRFYSLQADTVQVLQVYRPYVNQFLLPPDKTTSIGRESIILDKNAPVPVLPIDSAGAAMWCSGHAVTLSKLSKDAQDKKLAARLLDKALALNHSSAVKNTMNVVIYNFGDKDLAIEQQVNLLAELKAANDQYLPHAETTLQKMKSNELKISNSSFRPRVANKH